MKIEEIEPIEEEIGSLKAGFQNADFKLEFWLAVGLKPFSDWLLKIFQKVGWEFGSSKFISDTETITYFKKGHGALLLTTRQLIKGVEQWKNLKLIKFSERPLSSLGIDLSYCSRAPPSGVQILCMCSLAPWLLSTAVTALYRRAFH